jgi:hypothetical protein
MEKQARSTFSTFSSTTLCATVVLLRRQGARDVVDIQRGRRRKKQAERQPVVVASESIQACRLSSRNSREGHRSRVLSFGLSTRRAICYVVQEGFCIARKSAFSVSVRRERKLRTHRPSALKLLHCRPIPPPVPPRQLDGPGVAL